MGPSWANQDASANGDSRLGTRSGVAWCWNSPTSAASFRFSGRAGSLAPPKAVSSTGILCGKYRLCSFQSSLSHNLGYVIVSHHIPILAIDQIFFLFDRRREIDG